MTPAKACPAHGPIDRPLTDTRCPACGAELEVYGSPVELALALPPTEQLRRHEPPPIRTAGGLPLRGRLR